MRTREILLIVILMILPGLAFAFDCGYKGYKGCAIAEIKQIGFLNDANIETSGVNRASISQEGLKNQGQIKQSWASFSNNGEILQYGNYNLAYQHQIGIYNYAYAEQTGLFNSTIQEQKGLGNIANAKQFGVGNEAVQIQQTSFNSATALQIGFYNKAYQIQGLTGTWGNKSNLMQIGFGKITIIVQ